MAVGSCLIESGSLALGIEILIVIHNSREKRRAGNATLCLRDPCIGNSGSISSFHRLRTANCLAKRNACRGRRSSAGLGLHRQTGPANYGESTEISKDMAFTDQDWTQLVEI